jgi:phytoene dehydrogenase-like protein
LSLQARATYLFGETNLCRSIKLNIMSRPTYPRRKAHVIGAGPNGLAAAIVLAQAGLDVQLFEAEPTIGGAARTMDLTLPGFHHDFASAVHPMAVGSPFFSTLPLVSYGLEWIHSPATLAHPFDDGTAITLPNDLASAESAFGADGPAWRSLMEPLATHWQQMAPTLLGPILSIPRHPFHLAQFGLNAILPATNVARRHFRTEPVRALFAGLAAHSFLSLDEPISASFGLVLGAAAHAVGWPIPRGGAQSLSNALAAHFTHLGGRIATSARVDRLADLPPADLILCDLTPRQLLALAGPNRLTPVFRRNLQRFKYGPAAFKVDYALSAPIPWNAPACLTAATVHLGGSLDDIAASESAMASGRTAESPFVLLSQPTLFDPSRAPAGKHIAWAYCHVPNGSTDPATLDRIESQIEGFASGFRSTILARHISTPATLEAMDANLVGGDISGGAMSPGQLLFRPTHRQYRTSAPDIYLCSSSTPPGGGVHGMCGFHAARLALCDLTRR